MSDQPLAHSMRVDPERIWQHLQTFARIGYRPGARMQRLAFNRHDLHARQVLIHIMHQIGLETRVDEFGNVFGRLLVPEPYASEAPVLIGSHLDTVPSGGRFDGSLGVVTAIEAVTLLKEHLGELRRPVEVVSFSCEESSRFGRGTLGSGLMSGIWDAAEVARLRDASGRTLGEVLQRAGLNARHLDNVRRKPGDVHSFLEIHIEQGRVLEENEAKVGVVTAIAAPTRFRLTLTGQSDHSGATPMALRRDALCGAAEVVLAVERLASSLPEIVGTVGAIKAEPGAINVVPGAAELAIDIRGTSSKSKRQIVDALYEAVDDISQRRQLTTSYQPLTDEEPVLLDQQFVSLLEECCQDRDILYTLMPSGAGHDAMQMAHICPTAMLLTPSRAGISHDPGEWTDLKDIVYGAQVYTDAVGRLARQP